MSDQCTPLLRTTARHPLLTTKGAAAPSPARQMAQDQMPRHAPSSQIESVSAGNLAGLIKRNTPPRSKPVSHIHSHSYQTIKKPEAAHPTPRRQLTVRIDMAQFKKLDDLTQATGKNYQDILAHALKIFLKNNQGL